MKYTAKLIKVHDGDTVDLFVNFGFGYYQTLRIRLVGVDAPEIYGVPTGTPEYDEGIMAKLEVEKWFYEVDPVVFVEAVHRDIYGRILGIITDKTEERNLNDYMRDIVGWSGKNPLYTLEPLLDDWGSVKPHE